MATDRTAFSPMDMTEFAGIVATAFTEANPLASPEMMVFRNLTGTKTAKIPIEVRAGTANVPHKTDRTTIASTTRGYATLSVDDPIEANEFIAREELRKHGFDLLKSKGELLGREVAETWLKQQLAFMSAHTAGSTGTAKTFSDNKYNLNHATIDASLNASTDCRDAVLAISGKMDQSSLSGGWMKRKLALCPVMFNSLFALEEVQATHFGGPAAIRDLGAGNLYYADMHIIKVGGSIMGTNYSTAAYSAGFGLSADGQISGYGWPSDYTVNLSGVRGLAWHTDTIAQGYTTPPPNKLAVMVSVEWVPHKLGWLLNAAFEGDIEIIHPHASVSGAGLGLFGIGDDGTAWPGPS